MIRTTDDVLSAAEYAIKNLGPDSELRLGELLDLLADCKSTKPCCSCATNAIALYRAFLAGVAYQARKYLNSLP